MTCPYCGGALDFSVLEWWPEERGVLAGFEPSLEDDGCECDGAELMTEDWTRALADGEKWARELLDAGAGIPVRRSTLAGLDYGIEVEEIELEIAKSFVDAHHAHHDPPLGHKWSLGLYNGHELVGVAIVGRPVSRHLDDGRTLEVTRLATRRDLDGAALARHGASKLYAAAARRAKKEGAWRIVTYTLAGEESGASVRAAGWKEERITKAEGWSRAGRTRDDDHPTGRKVRWGRWLATVTEGLPLFSGGHRKGVVDTGVENR